MPQRDNAESSIGIHVRRERGRRRLQVADCSAVAEEINVVAFMRTIPLIMYGAHEVDLRRSSCPSSCEVHASKDMVLAVTFKQLEQ